jgi:hypothetical protein
VRALSPGTLDRLHAALPPGGGSCTRAFAGEIVLELAYPLGAAESRDPNADEAIAARAVLDVIGAAFEGVPGAVAEGARRLAEDAPMLAAFFQNLDLLADCDRGHAKAVAALVAEALAGPPHASSQ